MLKKSSFAPDKNKRLKANANDKRTSQNPSSATFIEKSVEQGARGAKDLSIKKRSKFKFVGLVAACGIIAIVLGVLLLGPLLSGDGGAIAGTIDASTVSVEADGELDASFGQTVNENGIAVSVSGVSEVQDGLIAPLEEGQKIVAVRVSYKNNSKNSVNYSASDWKIDSPATDGRVIIDYIYFGSESELQMTPVELAAGQKAEGVVYFSLPAAFDLRSDDYSVRFEPSFAIPVTTVFSTKGNVEG